MKTPLAFALLALAALAACDDTTTGDAGGENSAPAAQEGGVQPAPTE
ncbi:MAG: hypothetical protein AAGF90_07435 [Pseudomonadota bacterium]